MVGILGAVLWQTSQTPDHAAQLRDSQRWRAHAVQLCSMGSAVQGPLVAAIADHSGTAEEWPLRDGIAEVLQCMRCEGNLATGVCAVHPSEDRAVSPEIIEALATTVRAEPNLSRKQSRLLQLRRSIDFRFDFALYAQLIRTAGTGVEHPAPPTPNDYMKLSRVKPEVRAAWCAEIAPELVRFSRHNDATWLPEALALAESCRAKKLARAPIMNRYL